MLNPIVITARDIPDAWHQLVLSAPDNAQLFTIDKGSYAGQQRLEFDFVTIQITHPETRPFEPDLPPHMAGIPAPVDKGYIEAYLPYLMEADKAPGELYTYGERLRRGVVFNPDSELNCRFLDQIQEVIQTYKQHGHRNNQMCMTVGTPGDFLLCDPACLRTIDTRIQHGKLIFYVYFRSWDAWGGFPANMGAIQYLKEYMAGEIGVQPGESICVSKGLHYYGYVVPLVLARGLRTGRPFEGIS